MSNVTLIITDAGCGSVASDLNEETVVSGSFADSVFEGKKYNLYSKTTGLIEDKINKTVLLLHGEWGIWAKGTLFLEPFPLFK
jgi:hypothetical protein